MLIFECHCGQKLRGQPGTEGKKIQCPRCGAVQEIPWGIEEREQAPPPIPPPPKPAAHFFEEPLDLSTGELSSAQERLSGPSTPEISSGRDRSSPDVPPSRERWSPPESDVYIWPTLVGAVILTPDAFGFGFFAKNELSKLQADLEMGVPLHKAVGFSGSYCHYSKLSRVFSKANSKTIYVEARGFLGKDREDFTFLTFPAREEFYQTLVKFLGPEWERHKGARRGCLALLVPVGLFLLGLLVFLSALTVNFFPPNPKAAKPGAEAPPEVGWIMVGFSLAMFAIGFVWFRLVRGTVWDTIRKR